MKGSRPTNNNQRIVNKGEKFTSAQFYIQYGIDIEKRRITLDECVDEYSIGYAIRGIHKMLDESDSKPIDIFINSYGGYVYDGLALYDTIRQLEDTLEVRTHAMGKVMSMGLTLFLAGTQRFALPHSTFMAHSIAGGTHGKMYEIKDDSKETERLHKVLLKIYEARTSKSAQWWKKEIEYRDRFYDLDTAVELGIVTHGYDEEEDDNE